MRSLNTFTLIALGTVTAYLYSIKAAGLKILMVTGDNATTAKAVAGRLAIEFEADVLPEKKAEVVSASPARRDCRDGRGRCE